MNEIKFKIAEIPKGFKQIQPTFTNAYSATAQNDFILGDLAILQGGKARRPIGTDDLINSRIWCCGEIKLKQGVSGLFIGDDTVVNIGAE